MLKFGMHILKGISKKNSISDFVLLDWYRRVELFTEMLTRLTPDESSRFSVEHGDGGMYACIRLIPSSEY